MKTKIIATLQLLAVLLLCSSCATTYHAPDATKLKAAAQKLNKAIAQSHSTAAKAKTKHKEAQAKHQESEDAANQVFLNSLDIDKKLDDLAKQAPPELQPLVKAVQNVRTEQKQHESDLEKRLAEEDKILKDEAAIHDQLTQDNQAVVIARTDWDAESRKYQAAAAAVAATATEDNKKLSSQLWKQKFLGILGWTGGIVFVLCLVGGFLLWKSGKLALWAGKTYAKI
jgi:signal transduction protein with GAF and PtsI domain